MKYVRVRNEAGHEFSEPEGSPLLKREGVRVVDRKAATTLPLPPKFNPLPKTNVPAKPDDTKEA